MEVAKIENVTRIFKIGKVETQALRGVNLSIGSGEFTALVGPSGSGKTTLLQLIGCLDQPTTGKIWIMAPHMTCSMKPMVIRWVMASVAGVQRDANAAGPSISRSSPANTTNSGAVTKKRSGAAKGGAFSKESSACMTVACRQREIRISNVPSGISSVL